MLRVIHSLGWGLGAFILFLLSGLQGSLCAEEFQVDINGGGDFTSIQEALDASSDGDKIIVWPGTYTGRIVFLGRDVVLESRDGPEDTILDGDGDELMDVGPGGAVLGFTLTNAFDTFGAAMSVFGQGTLIEGNIFDSNIQSGGGFGAAIGCNGASPRISKNIFRGNACDTQHLSGVVSLVNNSSAVIDNKIFEDNECRAVNATMPANTFPVIINNTIVRNRVGVKVSRQVSAETQIYRNNIIVSNGIGLEVEFGDDTFNPIWENNLLFDNEINYDNLDDQTGMNGNLMADPLFVSAESSDYQLLPESPAIDAGTAEGAPADDIDGMPRPIDGNIDGEAQVDIGAYEAPLPLPIFRRGDCSEDGVVDISDAMFTVEYLFFGVGDVQCEDACDANDDQEIDISDAIFSMRVTFLELGALPDPGAFDCGIDTTDDHLECETSGSCE